MKIAVVDQIKICDNRIRANQAQYDLDGKAAKIYALSSVDLDKYKYFTGKDIGYKPCVVQEAKFDYSPLAKFFSKGLDEKDKKEGLLKRLKNIEDKNKKQLKAIENKNANPNDESFSLEKVCNEIAEQDEKIDYKRFVFVGSGKHRYNLSHFVNPKDFFHKMFSCAISINDAKSKQRPLEELLRDLDD